MGVMQREAGITVTGLIVIVMAALGWGLARFIGGRTLYLMVYGALGLLAVGIYLARRRRPSKSHCANTPLPARVCHFPATNVTVTAGRIPSTFVLEESPPPSPSNP